MAEYRKTTAALAVLALLGASGCNTEDSVLLLEQICRATFSIGTSSSVNGDACTVAGDAQETSGLTGDSLAFRLGPKTGELRIRLDVIEAVTNSSWSLDVLAASNRPEGSTIYGEINWGSCSGRPSTPKDAEASLGEGFEWVNMVDNQAGVSVWGSVDLASNSLIIFRGADVDIIDLRTPGSTSAYYDE